METAIMSKDYGAKAPYEALNNCIQERYLAKGYQVVIAQYPDKETYGILPKPQDQIIYTDITFREAIESVSNSETNVKLLEEKFDQKYASRIFKFDESYPTNIQETHQQSSRRRV